jgi:hypothetical protein
MPKGLFLCVLNLEALSNHGQSTFEALNKYLHREQPAPFQSLTVLLKQQHMYVHVYALQDTPADHQCIPLPMF